ncbi:MAG: hypothetical protein A2167_03500 [Planctomycetes bacterium RBG_13_46_10]|nr:MAG: hypothetical protein A2167_03500 [Planctomycetes bacterium RBG_13_46_10]
MNKKVTNFLCLLLPAFALILGLNANTNGEPIKTGFIAWPELKNFSNKWLKNQYSGDDSFIHADLDLNQNVDLADFSLWSKYWRKNKSYTISYDPYKNVNWNRWRRALAQHHDHMGRLAINRIRAYDQAGYNVIVPLDYAGKKSGGSNYCDYRLWPVYKYLSGFKSDEAVLASLNNIRLFIPAMEEIGCHHITSPFLTTYIELWEPAYSPIKQQWHYQTSQECIDLINQYGGMAIIAHPTEKSNYYLNLQNYKGIEIINAHYYRLWFLGQSQLDYNEHFQAVWDDLLTNKDTKIWGFGVNDWWGPWNNSNEAFIDSGKILVMVPSYSIADYRNSLEKGSFFAIQDCGAGKQNKGKYPIISSIIVSNHSITIYTNGQVNWIANGQIIAQGNSIDMAEYPIETGLKYVRAEISNAYGTIFTQPWTLFTIPE